MGRAIIRTRDIDARSLVTPKTAIAGSGRRCFGAPILEGLVMPRSKFIQKIKNVFIGKSRDLSDQNLFHKVSLIALFAWVGLGADGLSSSCYGPQEAFTALNGHNALSIFVGLASALTVVVLCTSYSQIIELFPTGGGGYIVASKLLSPASGVVSGSALMIDYVLTITVSVASGADALFSLLPAWQPWKFWFEAGGIAGLTLLNLRGVRESVMMCLPIFLVFLATHAFALVYGIATHLGGLPELVTATAGEVRQTQAQLGTWGLIFLLLRAYSMGAGTYTGIEAVSNGLPILREPRVATGKRTMHYMAVSLAVTVAGLLLTYVLFDVKPEGAKTLNAVLFERMTQGWGGWGFAFVLVTLVSEGALLFIAAQTGFLGGPRVLASMALDRWFPSRFASLSDRLVSQNGVLLMGVAALVVLAATGGAVTLLVILYSINVFITFSLSQGGMVRYWLQHRNEEPGWRKKLLVNGVGFGLTVFILVSLTAVKFHEGGWVTLLVTGVLVGLAFLIKRHYENTGNLLRRLDELVTVADAPVAGESPIPSKPFDPQARTAVILVNGFNGLGLHTLFGVIRLFGTLYRNFVFIQVGVVDAGNFKGASELAHLEDHVKQEANRYVEYMNRRGFHAEAFTARGIDVVEEIVAVAPRVVAKYPNAVFFGGQLVFPQETFFTRWLHNFAVFAVQRQFYYQGYPFLILPIRV